MKKSIFIISLIILAGGGGYFYYGHFGMQADTQARREVTRRLIPPVRVAAARAGDLRIYLDSLGTVTPQNSVIVRPRIEGQIKEILFREGQNIKKGEILAEIDPRGYQLQLDQFEAQFARDEILLENAQRDLGRYRGLEKNDAVAKQQLDTQNNLVRQYQASLKVTRAQIENARLLLSYCTITAPVSGKIGLRRIDSGNLIKSTDANGLAVINQLQPISVVFSVPEDSLAAIMKSLRSNKELLVEAWSRAGNSPLAQGTLASMDNQIDITTGTIKLKAFFSNQNEELFPNQFVKVRLRLETRRGSTLIPGAAVQYGANGALVYILNADKSVAVRAVNLGPAEGEQVIIESGINPGEKVVVDGIDKLRPGIQVEVAAD